MKNYKEIIPNILTVTRIFLTPIMIILSILGKFKIVLTLAIICALTDMLDGKLARYWNTVSLTGAKLDAISDKVFGIGIIICLIFKDKSIAILLLFEIILAITNLYYYFKTNKTKSLIIGKFKTTFLFLTIILAYVSIINPKLSFLTNGFKLSTINLQILSLISYFSYFYNNMKQNKKNVEEANIENTIVAENLVDLTKKYGFYKNEDEQDY